MPLENRECPPGLSIAQANWVTAKQSLSSDILLKRKVGLVQAEILYSVIPIITIKTLYVVYLMLQLVTR